MDSILQPIFQMRKRQLLQQVVNFGLVIGTALMIWKGLQVYTKSESPIVVVLSGSMEPAFQRGDLLFLSLGDDPVRIGEVCVFQVNNREIPIVHRVLKIHEKPDGKVDILTKGDNNPVDDRGLYPKGVLWLQRDHIIGRAKAFVPYVGMVTIIMNDYPWFKFVLIAGLGLFVILSRE